MNFRPVFALCNLLGVFFEGAEGQCHMLYVLHYMLQGCRWFRITSRFLLSHGHPLALDMSANTPGVGPGNTHIANIAR